MCGENGHFMKNIITMRKLLATKRDGAILKKLQQLNVGVSYDSSRSILGSRWTIGSIEPTLEWVQWVRAHQKYIDEMAAIFGWQSWLDRRIRLELNWMTTFGYRKGHSEGSPTGPMDPSWFY